jgi:4-hydroxy-3-polyprenylbenzoate decarboxylase
MAKLSTWGVIVLPASPGFYTLPDSVADMVDFIVSRILDHLGIDNQLSARWTGEELN